MLNKEDYGKILVPMVTPFKSDQSVDYEAAVSIAEKLVQDKKADSLILSGTTGEFHTMTFNERVKLFSVIKEAVGERISLVAGVGAASTTETIALTKKAEELGYELVMIVAPYYAKPNQQELYTHFKMVAESTSLDIILYNIPIFTGVNIDPDTVKKLSEIDNIVGIKEEAELNPKQITAYVNVTPEDFIIYCGDDTMVIEAFAQGGVQRIGGVISGGAHLIGDWIRDTIDHFLNGDVQKAAEMQQLSFRLYRSLGQNNRINPVALLKEAMKLVGYNAGIPRLPLSPGTQEEVDKIKIVMEELNII